MNYQPHCQNSSFSSRVQRHRFYSVCRVSSKITSLFSTCSWQKKKWRWPVCATCSLQGSGKCITRARLSDNYKSAVAQFSTSCRSLSRGWNCHFVLQAWSFSPLGSLGRRCCTCGFKSYSRLLWPLWLFIYIFAKHRISDCRSNLFIRRLYFIL